MGTDSVKLFNKALADRILAMGQGEFARFMEENVTALKRKRFTLNSVLYAMEQSGCAASDAVERLLAGESTLAGLKQKAVNDFAFGDEEIHLDYWGCYAEVFVDQPVGAISSLDYLADEEEETFLLLRPEHVSRMIASLRDHMDDLQVMTAEDVAKLEGWRDYCAANPNYMVAYILDF